MKQEDIEKAWRLLSMHNSELLIENADLRNRLRNVSVRQILWMRIRNLFRSQE
jgi:hypothetical protein